MHMIWLGRSTYYVSRVIVVIHISSHPLTYIVATKHASRGLPRALQDTVIGKKKKNNTVKHIVLYNQYYRYLSKKMVVPIDVEK
jgi:hypothetical protein